jgi:uncharacterized YigZ family protein
MQDDTYRTIQSLSEGLYKDKGSKFLAFAEPVETVEAVKQCLERYRKNYHDARHVCYAYVLGPDRSESRSSDDGEPSGTAGRPILGQIQSVGLTNVLVVVVRYFGGILLGTGGLVVAYRSAAAEALTSAVTIEKTVERRLHLSFEYPLLNEVMKPIKQLGATVLSQRFELDCQLEVSVRANDADRLQQALMKIDTVALTDQ